MVGTPVSLMRAQQRFAQVGIFHRGRRNDRAGSCRQLRDGPAPDHVGAQRRMNSPRGSGSRCIDRVGPVGPEPVGPGLAASGLLDLRTLVRLRRTARIKQADASRGRGVMTERTRHRWPYRNFRGVFRLECDLVRAGHQPMMALSEVTIGGPPIGEGADAGQPAIRQTSHRGAGPAERAQARRLKLRVRHV